MSDPLNDILVECCKLRGCYPLMHRTLHEFNWFCSCAIWGAGPYTDSEIATAEVDGDEAHARALKDRRNEENGIRDRFGEWYSHGSDELIRFAEAFLIYCREQYGDEECPSGAAAMTDKPRKWNLPLTYGPKIAGVCDGSIRQTIRVGRKFSPGDLVSFHGWSGRPYRSPWSFRTPYAALKAVIPITIWADGIEAPREFRSWGLLDEIARLDGIEPPTGEALCRVLSGMHKIPDTGIEAQILRW